MAAPRLALAMASGADPHAQATDPARERREVRHGKNDAALGLRDTRHLVDGALRRIEVIERPLAKHRVEGLVGKRQRVGPGANEGRR